MVNNKNIPRSRELKEDCRNHPTLEADGRCGQCWGFFCDACLETVGERRFCRTCAPEARQKHEAAIAEKNEARRRLDLRLLVYVLSGVLAVTVIGGILYFTQALDDLFITYMPYYQVTNQAQSLGSTVDGFRVTKTEHFRIYYHNAGLAAALASLTEQYLDSILKDTLIYEKDVTSRGLFNVVVPANEAELQKLYPDVPPTRIALTDYPTKAIVFTENSDISAIQRDLVHELTHAIIFERFKGATDIPEWLTEGLASYEEARIDSTQVSARWTTYGPGIAAGGFIPLASLKVDESTSQEGVNIYYAESHSLVDYLITDYGMLKFMKLLTDLESGEDINSAIAKAYPGELSGLNDLERKWLASI